MGTHPIPQTYFETHKNLGTWSDMKWNEIINPTLTDEKTRIAFN